MTKRSVIESELARETAHSRFSEQAYYVESDFERTRRFHEAMGLPSHHEPRMPSVSERLLRARLLMEETMETIEKGLGVRVSFYDAVHDMWHWNNGWQIDHEEGVMYDPIETLDGLADVKVIANGTAIQFGLPLPEAEFEVFSSNMTKLDENGYPIVNRCHACHPVWSKATREQLSCDDEHHKEVAWTDSTKPLGKLLKPDTYVPANIARIIVESQPDDDQNATRGWLLMHGESDHV